LAESLLKKDQWPDWIRAHYADAGYVAALLRRRLGIPLGFTGHSLGLEKRRRLIDAGLDPRQIEALRHGPVDRCRGAGPGPLQSGGDQHPPGAGGAVRPLRPFLRDPAKPPVLAICRADHRKNTPALVEVFGRSERLRRQHNLVLLLGCRNDPRQLEKQQREVFQQVFELVDRFDLYGQVAYLKQHERHQIPSIYRWASRLGGVFVNPASPNP